ncbi:methyltransferase domain-containing protein [Phaeovulum sp. NW3]|uniref:methyltransferase domain-containing protein n=1 Tax=Phaeovulum sp. NW3 TaxID=2934933 RepID=UPI0020228F9A|nr:methyltransferase domain-containing protein [Phaeovulum sp. NW3]MCL7465888.1 methyltransferase domain-containing protein [Phaeovulum sp. NW3]
MTTPPLLTDRPALDRNRARARRSGPALFLHDDAAAELEERLNEVNRTFTAPAVVTAFPDPWREILPAARIVADDELLDLEPGAHDLVVHALALHWANDPVGQIVQAARALRPDGLFIAVMFGGQTLAELRAALAEAEVAVTGGLSPRVLPMGEIRDLGALLQRAGLALPVADSVLRRVSYADPFRLLADLRAMGEANALTGRRRTFTPRAVFAQAASRYAAAYAEPGGRVRASFDMVWLTGWKPHASQQKPLRPGSAAARLADALGAAEQSAGDKAGQ